ncbi:DUF397 domain-containing protein [Actinoallomurus spadix]
MIIQLDWRKSSRSDTVGNQCIEVASVKLSQGSAE